MSAASSRILILGGYGTFGGRLARLLSDEPRVELAIAGRSLEKGRAFCDALAGAARRTPCRFDRDADVDAQIKEIAPAIVVDASGPFQAYGEAPYRVVQACLRYGAHYLDLADGSQFVREISRFDQEAKARALFALSGVSSFPVLTAAAVRALLPGMQCLDSIVGGLAPTPYAGVGLNVIRAIASYAGQGIELRRDSRIARGYPFTETRCYTVAPPGRLPLHRIRYSLVDVPDLQVLADLWPEVRSVWMGAGPVPAVLHRALRGLAWLVRLRIIPTLSPLASLMYWASNVLQWGEHRGGMFIEVAGLDGNGQPTTRSWHLLAEGDDGPLIPSMAAEAIVRRCLDGRPPSPGARPAVRDLALDDYDKLFSRRKIYMGSRIPSRVDPTVTLYRRMLGDAWCLLPEPIRRMHDVRGRQTAVGVAEVDRGTSRVARLIAAAFRFPNAARAVPVEVRFDERDGKQLWVRRFGDRAFSSSQEEGKGAFDRLLCERFGPLAFGLALVVDEGRLRFVVRRWTFLGVPLPAFLSPRGQSYESAVDDKFHFRVEIAHPWIGLIVRYRGWLTTRDLSPNTNPR